MAILFRVVGHSDWISCNSRRATTSVSSPSSIFVVDNILSIPLSRDKSSGGVIQLEFQLLLPAFPAQGRTAMVFDDKDEDDDPHSLVREVFFANNIASSPKRRGRGVDDEKTKNQMQNQQEEEEDDDDKKEEGKSPTNRSQPFVPRSMSRIASLHVHPAKRAFWKWNHSAQEVQKLLSELKVVPQLGIECFRCSARQDAAHLVDRVALSASSACQFQQQQQKKRDDDDDLTIEFRALFEIPLEASMKDTTLFCAVSVSRAEALEEKEEDPITKALKFKSREDVGFYDAHSSSSSPLLAEVRALIAQDIVAAIKGGGGAYTTADKFVCPPIRIA